MKKCNRYAPTVVKAICLVLVVCCFTTACSRQPIDAADDEAASSDEITEREAVQSVSDLIGSVYAVTADIERMHAEEYGEDKYSVSLESGEKEQSAYYAHVDKKTGEILHISQNYDQLTLTREQLGTAKTYNAPTAVESDTKQMAFSCIPIAQELVERVFADGRSMIQADFFGVMTDSDIEPIQMVYVGVRMDEGTCYVVTVAWPQMEVFSVTAFPLGWHSCYYGYQDPAEADEYPPLED